jgi:hypothetical protein
MNIAISDRRGSPRHNFKLRLCVRILKSAIAEQQTESEDLSARGIYSPTNSPLRVGTAIQLLVKMPEEIAGEPTIEWLCGRGPLGPRVWSSAFEVEIKWGFTLTAWLSERASDCRNSFCLRFPKKLPDPL